MTRYEVVIGLEVHCQLDTASKMFSACGYAIGAAANTRTDPYTWGMPGTLPVANRRAVEHALRLALAMGCEIQAESRWARKHYFYPDLPKGYQITQADQPYARGGFLEIPDPAADAQTLASKRVHLQRIHMEEDAGKNTHDASPEHSLIDYNRAGAPLVEIVSQPELRSAAEAADYVRELRTLVRYLGISEANMEEGTLRCDANVSLRPQGTTALGVRCEIKNLNSFKFLEAAINAEIRRQTDLLERGEAVVQSTLSYDPARDRTKIMRSKEEAADYRYFPEPDMPPLRVDADTLERLRQRQPELPWDRRRRLVGMGLSAYDAGVLCAEQALAIYFDATLGALGGAGPEQAQAQAHAKEVCNWITGEVLRLLNANRDDLAACPIGPAALAELIALVQSGAISRRAGKEVLEKAYQERLSPAQIVERDDLRQVSDSAAIEALVQAVIDQNPAQVEQLLAGKDKVRGFFVGQVMRASKGQANPQLVQEALDKLLAARKQETPE